jgi:uncharacterized protein YggE
VLNYKMYWKLGLVVGAIALQSTVPTVVLATGASPVAKDRRVAQLLYPPTSDRPIIAVTGQGFASTPADLAYLQLRVNNTDPQTASEPGASKPKVAPLTLASLAKITDALKNIGITSQNIKVTIDPLDGRSRYANSDGSIGITIEKPTTERIDQVVRIAKLGSLRNSGAKAYIESATVQYALKSCTELENAAYLAAVKDAKVRAEAVAKAMNVKLADPPSIAEIPFLGRLYSPCTQEKDVISAIFSRSANSYKAGTPAEVGVYRELGVSYRLQ